MINRIVEQKAIEHDLNEDKKEKLRMFMDRMNPQLHEMDLLWIADCVCENFLYHYEEEVDLLEGMTESDID